MGIKVEVIRPSGPLINVAKMKADLVDVMNMAVEEGKTFMREYPPRRNITRASVYGEPFVSDKQRRWFFAALRDGSLMVPRTRTMTLAKSWNEGSGVQVEADRIVGTIGSNANLAPYNMYVQSSEKQSMFMAALGWKTEEDMKAAVVPKFRQMVQDIIKEHAEK